MAAAKKGGKAKAPEPASGTNAGGLGDVYRRNRSLLWKYWEHGDPALRGIPKTAGVRRFINFFKAGEPSAVRGMERQCCGNPPQDVTIDTVPLEPGTTFVAVLASGATLSSTAAALPGRSGDADEEDPGDG